jgi:transcriptional regulator with XRE-family HTH domain
MKSIQDPRYKELIEKIIELRKSKGVTQTALAESLDKPQSYVAKVENYERRLDVIELNDWLKGLDTRIGEFLIPFDK